MSALNWEGFAVALVTSGSACVGSIRWLVKHYLAELKPNGGSSMNDRLTRLEARVETVIQLLDR